ncbi:methionine--tRNA ligase subunit beta [Candidatus Micrarchaeota archaeon CG10_big_fil_rev_8_21_14_0_10_54_18]|nr:MAG: methionine--tRNA ligase subunit beta [Candidatus Micrarchaeota archaeon CG1_02_55_41]PJD01508.1 MAG: methionine--tRNA ligase subunit beta [Candidatus Micrarchaeota archaeon CG10_big_fil_rev_8_21_14_0_10_54_18]
METIFFNDFAKLDLRVALVKEVEKVEGADKLYKLVVDLGGEERTLAAGLAEHYAPDEIKGKKIVVVANLAPRNVRGIESKGMLLAAEKDGVVSLLTVDKDVAAGAQIH